MSQPKPKGPAATPAPPPRRWIVWAAGAVIVLAAVAAYSNSFGGPFVLDDIPSIRENPSIRHLATALTLARGTTAEGRPIPNLSLAINYRLGGLDVWGYHFVNLLIHVAAALVLFGLVRRTLLLPGLAPRFGRAATGLALAVAALWAVHPLQTESVTYIVQRTESIMGLFYLLTLYLLIRSATSARPARWSFAAVVACGLGMASKEVMVSAPVIALLYDRLFLSGSFRETFRRRWGLYTGLAASWLFILLPLATASEGRSGSAGFGLGISPWNYAMTQFGNIAHYLGQCFWPRTLVFDYGTRLASGAAEIVPWAIVVLALVAATVVAIRYSPRLGFLGVVFFAALAPSSSIVPLVTQTAAEHRMYVPLAAVATLAVMLVYLAWERMLAAMSGDGSRRALALAIVPGVIFATAAGTLGYRTFLRNADYRSTESIWQATLTERPDNARAHLNLGVELLDRGDAAAAMARFSETIDLDPRYARAYHNRGNAYLRLGQYEQAIRDYNRALELDPNDAAVYSHRGEAYRRMGRTAESIADGARAARLAPDSAITYSNRGNANYSAGRFDDAAKDYSLAIELDPNDAAVYYNRSEAYQNLGRSTPALADLDKAIALRSDYGPAYNNRGILYAQLGRNDPALADLTKAIELRPADTEPRFNRGALYDRLGQYAQAIADYSGVIALRPDYAPAYNARALAQYRTGQYDAAWADVAACRRLGAPPKEEFVRLLAQASGRSE